MKSRILLNVVPVADDIVIELIPVGHGCKPWPGHLPQWVETESVNDKIQDRGNG